MKEMDKTRRWADELTQKAKGKHHIGDFLPPEELAKFMEKVYVHIFVCWINRIHHHMALLLIRLFLIVSSGEGGSPA